MDVDGILGLPQRLRLWGWKEVIPFMGPPFRFISVSKLLVISYPPPGYDVRWKSMHDLMMARPEHIVGDK